jgi:hypothetical protein
MALRKGITIELSASRSVLPTQSGIAHLGLRERSIYIDWMQERSVGDPPLGLFGVWFDGSELWIDLAPVRESEKKWRPSRQVAVYAGIVSPGTEERWAWWR